MIKAPKSNVASCPFETLSLCHFAYDYMSKRTGKTVYQSPPSLKTETTARSPLRSEDAGITNWVQTDARSFVYDSWNLIQELASDNGQQTTNHYIWGIDLSGSLSGAGGIGGLLAAQLDTNSVVYCYDANGNVSELLDVSGAIAAHYEYSPFGETIGATGPSAAENKFRFSTKPAEDNTGLVLYEYRAHSPSLGRWLSRDPIEERGGVGLYLFVVNRPINRSDPLGLAQHCTLATDYHHIGLWSLLHFFIGPPDNFGPFRRTFFNYLIFPVNCPKCQVGSGPTVRVTSEKTYQVAGVNIDLERDFQVITWQPGTCTDNGSARVSVSTTVILKLAAGLGDWSWNHMVDIMADLELCYDCVSCK